MTKKDKTVKKSQYNGMRERFDVMIGYYQGVIDIHKSSKDEFVSMEVYEKRLKDIETTLRTLIEDYSVLFEENK